MRQETLALFNRLCELEGFTINERKDKEYLIDKIDIWLDNEFITNDQFKEMRGDLLTQKVKDFKVENKLPEAIYKEQSYIITTDSNMVVSAGKLDEINELLKNYGTYYDNCTIGVRTHDLYFNNNERI